MGDPRRLKKRYATPNNPFEKNRIEEELEYLGAYGLRNKKEFWKHKYQLSRFRARARDARSLPENLQKNALEDLRKTLNKIGILGPEGHFDDVLGLNIDQLLERRLQTQVFKQGLARSIYQARQFIVHRHIAVAGKVITAPSYLVKRAEENEITYAINSPMKNQTIEPLESSDSNELKEEG